MSLKEEEMEEKKQEEEEENQELKVDMGEKGKQKRKQSILENIE